MSARQTVQAYKELMDRIEQRLRREGHRSVTAQQAILLAALGDKTLTVGELLEEAGVGNGALHSIHRLERRRFITSRPDDADKRRRLVTATRAAAPIVDIVLTMEPPTR